MHAQWTAELSGLATGRSVQEYLPAGKSEKDSLMSLFAAIPSAEANSIYLSCVSDVSKFTDPSGSRRNPVLGTWSRLVLLGNRITDKDNFQDVDEGMRRAVVSSTTGALCTEACLKEPHAIATIFCLARRALLPQSSNEGDPTSPSLERYESWLRDLVLNSNAAVITPLLEALSQLVPLEPVRFLKLHHQIFSKNRGIFHVASGYLAQLRAQIRNFDPSFSNASTIGHSTENAETQASSKISGKVMTEIVQFVSNYKEKRELSKLLIRQMNFHRYHFRKVILPMLLHPNFVELKPSDGDVSMVFDPTTFDELRIDMIREIAFRRKDHAITAPEAKSAIDAIKVARTKREGQSVRNSESQAKLIFSSSSVKGTSSVHDIVSAILCDEVEHGFNNELMKRKDGDQIEKAKELLCANVSNCVTNCNNTDGLASVAVEVLEGFCSAVEDVDQKAFKTDSILEIMQPLNFSKSSNIPEKCKRWWRNIGLPFLSLLSQFLGDPRLVSLQTHIRYQIIALLCVRINSLSEKALFSLSLIIVALVILRSKTTLQNVCFLGNTTSPKSSQHIGLVIFKCLPLSKPEFVLPSITFALYYVFLLTSFPEDALLSLNIESDISMDATLAHNGHESVITEFSNVPRAFLRWMVLNPWRLTRVDGEAVDVEGDHLNQEISVLCQRAVSCLQDTTFFDGGVESLATILDLELRASWGCKFALAAQMQVMKSLGLSSMIIINTVVNFLATAKKIQHNGLDWIHQGLMLFYEGTTDTVPTSIEDSVTENIRKCVEEVGTDVANNMIDYYRSMELPYFKGCDDACEHIAQVLILKMWPLSHQDASYLLRCLSSHDMTITRHFDPFFVANCTLVCDLHRDTTFYHLVEPPVDSDHDILKTVKYVACESNILFQHCCGGNPDHPGSNGSVVQSQVNSYNMSALSLLNAQSLGIALSMKLVKKTECRAAMPGIVQQIVSTIVAQAERPTTLDVLDGVTISIALLHCREIRRTSYLTERRYSWWNSLLSSFVQERVCLFEEKAGRLPFWIKSNLSDRLEFESEAGMNLLTEWFNSAHGSETHIEGQECIVRLLGSLGATKEGVLEQVIRALGKDKIMDTFLPNLGWCFVKTTKFHRASRVVLRRQLIGTIGRVANYLRPEMRGDFVASAMSRYGADGIEILTLLKAKGF